MRLGKLLSVGEVAEAAEDTGPEPAAEPAPVTAEVPTGGGHREMPATAQSSR